LSGTAGICLALAAAAGPPGTGPPAPPAAAAVTATATATAIAIAAATVFVPARHFTLAWSHSIEHVRWEEDYRVWADAPDAMPRLQATAARVRGSAAGMEPGPDAVLRNGWYVYRPAVPELSMLWLTRSPYTADYELCIDGARCRPLADWLPSDGWRTRLWPCLGGG